MDQFNKEKRCSDIREMVVPYFEKKHELLQVKVIEDHLRECSECRNEYRLYRELQRLDNARELGAVDPVALTGKISVKLDGLGSKVPTLKQIISEIKDINADKKLQESEKQKTMIIAIHRFLTNIRTFLHSRRYIRAGKEWLKLERRRTKLLRKILDEPGAMLVKPLMLLQAEAFVSRGLIFQIQGDVRQAEHNLSQSVVLFWALNQPKALQTQRFLGELKFYEGDLETADQLFTDALRNPALSFFEQAILLRNLGNVAYMNDDLSRCKAYLSRAISISESLNEPEYYARDLMNISAIDYHRGDLNQAIIRTKTAIDCLDSNSNPHLAGQLHANLGTFMSIQGDYRNARVFWDSALDLFETSVFVEDSLQVLRNIALAEYENGKLDETRKILESASLENSSNAQLIIQMELLMGRVYRVQGKQKKSELLLDRAESAARKLDELLLLDAILHEKMFLKMDMHKIDEAQRILAQTSAARKRKSIGSPSIFNIENETDLIKLHSMVGNKKESEKSRRRLKRMMRAYLKNRS